MQRQRKWQRSLHRSRSLRRRIAISFTDTPRTIALEPRQNEAERRESSRKIISPDYGLEGYRLWAAGRWTFAEFTSVFEIEEELSRLVGSG